MKFLVVLLWSLLEREHTSSIFSVLRHQNVSIIYTVRYMSFELRCSLTVRITVQ